MQYEIAVMTGSGHNTEGTFVVKPSRLSRVSKHKRARLLMSGISIGGSTSVLEYPNVLAIPSYKLGYRFRTIGKVPDQLSLIVCKLSIGVQS
jgi:hypothetical protein